MNTNKEDRHPQKITKIWRSSFEQEAGAEKRTSLRPTASIPRDPAKLADFRQQPIRRRPARRLRARSRWISRTPSSPDHQMVRKLLQEPMETHHLEPTKKEKKKGNFSLGGTLALESKQTLEREGEVRGTVLERERLEEDELRRRRGRGRQWLVAATLERNINS